MSVTRACEQCGAVFTPRREHARFCSARCRVAWNREQARDRPATESALGWSVTAMTDTISRLPRVRTWDRPRALAAIGEAVWWVTIVDATMLRHHPDIYDSVLAGHAKAERQRIEGTLAGLRFVRNQLGRDCDLASFIGPTAAGGSPRGQRVTAWTWNAKPRPDLDPIPPPSWVWEITRYQAYLSHLAGHTSGETFARATAFLARTAAATPPLAEAALDAGEPVAQPAVG
jgi:predicted nucleic acid-binding Zn ribbon protein